MTTHTLNSHEIVVVSVPEGAHDYEVHDNELVYFKNDLEDSDSIVLPPGSWSIIGSGLSSAITESEWDELTPIGFVENWMPGDSVDEVIGHRCFTDDTRLCQTAIESGLSWLQSIGVDPEKTVLLIDQNK